MYIWVVTYINTYVHFENIFIQVYVLQTHTVNYYCHKSSRTFIRNILDAASVSNTTTNKLIIVLSKCANMQLLLLPLIKTTTTTTTIRSF